jgi:two-component system sensor histidine kinase TctE
MAAVQPDALLRGRGSQAWRDLLGTHDSSPRDPLLERSATEAADDAAHPYDAADDEEPEPQRRWMGRWRARRARPAPQARAPQRSLFGEILDWMFAPLLLLWPLSVAVTFLVARSLADAPFDRSLIDRTEAMAQQVRYTRDRVDITLPRSIRDFLNVDDEDIVYYQVIGPRGDVLAGESDLPRPRLYDYPDPGRIKIRNGQHRGDEVRIAYMYLGSAETVDDPAEPAQVLVQVAETLDKRSRLANEIIKGVIFPQFMILPVAVMLVWFGLSRGLAPLKVLQRRIRNRRPDDLSPIDTRAAPEEIAPLVDAFNDLLLRLGQNVNAQKRFIADAAHQMKTPLAGLRTQSELALREHDPDEQRRTLEQIARGSQRAGNLLTQLLSLARTENLREAVAMERVDLDALSRTILADWVPMAIERGIDLGYACEGPVGPIAGHPILLREMLNNLVDNALRYTPRGRTVTIHLRARLRTVTLEVEDTGPGIPEPERALVFERFYRVLGTEVDGSGLGLAIVREIAEQHGASVRIEASHPDHDPPGARFVVVFPVAAAFGP